MKASSVRAYSVEDYFPLEREADYKHEYYQGEVYSILGGTIG